MLFQTLRRIQISFKVKPGERKKIFVSDIAYELFIEIADNCSLSIRSKTNHKHLNPNMFIHTG